MKKLIRGIMQFRKDVRPQYKEVFARLALGQAPDALLLACSDSRVVPNLFASTDPGDLFVLRNVGNMIPPCGASGRSESDESEIAALEFSLVNLHVQDIIVCGHSECGAMQALYTGKMPPGAEHLRSWLRHGQAALAKLRAGARLNPDLAPHNELSQWNVLEQLNNLRSYPVVQQSQVRLHAWWFDIAQAEVHAYDTGTQQFRAIDDAFGSELLRRLGA
jgi:carbonic anhydrase